MNIDRPPSDVRERHASLEWRGKPFQRKCRDGKTRTFIRARHRAMQWSLYFCYEDDFEWFPDADLYG
jgi:hypothetical protein